MECPVTNCRGRGTTPLFFAACRYFFDGDSWPNEVALGSLSFQGTGKACEEEVLPREPRTGKDTPLFDDEPVTFISTPGSPTRCPGRDPKTGSDGLLPGP